jgi:chemotaxis protein MotB
MGFVVASCSVRVASNMRRLALTLPFFAITLVGCKKIDELQAALDESASQLTKTKADLDSEKRTNQELRAANEQLEAQIVELQGEIRQLEAQIATLASDMETTAEELAALRKEKAEREKELAVYEELVAQLRSLVDAGTIKLEIRKGRLVVKLANEILFDSGRASLKEEGQTALAAVASALRTVAGREFLVGGHTDNVPIKNSRFRNNWDLSTARAISVVEYMVAEGMDPRSLGATGFAEFDPVEDNSTSEGRAMNRRIEIILLPNLAELPGVRKVLEGK